MAQAYQLDIPTAFKGLETLQEAEPWAAVMTFLTFRAQMLGQMCFLEYNRIHKDHPLTKEDTPEHVDKMLGLLAKVTTQGREWARIEEKSKAYFQTWMDYTCHRTVLDKAARLKPFEHKANENAPPDSSPAATEGDNTRTTQ